MKKYEGHCLPCCLHVCPDLTVSRNYKTKEKDVVDRVLDAFPGFSWVSDKRVADGCSARRPDLLVDMGSHVIIIEVDENAHEHYETTCENKRLMELSRDVHHRPIVFIRFNPDAYTTSDGRRVPSCWRMNKMGIMTAKKTEWTERTRTLMVRIQHWMDHVPQKTVELDALFFSACKG